MTDWPGLPPGLKGTASMCQRGFTLIELIIFIVVVSAGMAGILSVMDNTVKASADPMVRKQMVAVAESLLEEIVLKSYCDPDNSDADKLANPPCGTSSIESNRSLYDDVLDYSGYHTSSGIVDAVGNPTLGLERYNISPVVVVVDASELPGVTAKKITVSVTLGSDTFSLTGYRANY